MGIEHGAEPVIGVESNSEVLVTCVGDIVLNSQGPIFEHTETFSVVLPETPEADFDFPL